MKILFIVPNKRFIPSSFVRALSWRNYLKLEHIASDVINIESNFVILLYKYLEMPVFEKKSKTFRLLFFRFLKKIDFLQKKRLYKKLPKYANEYDFLFFQWQPIPSEIFKSLLGRKAKIVFDFDDEIFLKNKEDTNLMISLSDIVLTGNHFLYSYAKKMNQATFLFTNAVDLCKFKPKFKSKELICIGWLGSPSTAPYLNIVTPCLNSLWNKGNKFEILIAGCGKHFALNNLSPSIKITKIPSYRNKKIPEILEKIDIGIMPLSDSEWERGKSAMKVILYSSAFKPAIASNIGESRYIIKHGISGFLVNSESEWEISIKKLLNDETLRRNMGNEARRIVEQNNSLPNYFKKILATLKFEKK